MKNVKHSTSSKRKKENQKGDPGLDGWRKDHSFLPGYHSFFVVGVCVRSSAICWSLRYYAVSYRKYSLSNLTYESSEMRNYVKTDLRLKEHV